MENQRNQLLVVPIPGFDDNYSYLVLCGKENQGVLVDPADNKSIEQFFKKYPQIQIQNIFYTHKHYDHAGNADKIVDFLANNNNSNDIQLLAHAIDGDSIDTSKNLKKWDGQQQELNNEQLGYDLKAYHVPCHTKGHSLYNFKPSFSQAKVSDIETKIRDENAHYLSKSAIFTGDTLFIGGSGRFFEGKPEEMLKNFDLIASLPDDTDVFCGHEYTVKNYEWASQVEKDNQDMQEAFQKAKQQRSQNLYSIPSTIGQEKKSNIFMRCHQQSLQKLFNIQDAVHIMSRLREMKNNNQVQVQNQNL